MSRKTSSPSPKVPTKVDVTIEWLNQVFNPFNHIVKSFRWEGPANNGLGVMSTMERLALSLASGETLSVIFKTLPPKESPLHEITISHGFAIRELKMYTELFRVWEEFLDSRNVPEKFRFRRPKCYYGASVGDPSQGNYDQILVLEDLFTSGFKIWKEGYGKSLNWEEAQPCIRLLALFHAVGISYKKVNSIENYNTVMPFLDHLIDERRDLMEMFFKSGFEVVEEFAKKYGEKYLEEKTNPNLEVCLPLLPLPPKFNDHLKVMKEHGVYNLKFLNPREDQMGTVLHHDLHVNNLMFLDKECKEIHPAVFYDFQASMYSMPMKDLSFFLIQNCDESILTTDFERTIQYYHDELHEALEAMCVPMHSYSLNSLKEEYKFIAGLSALHIIAGAAQSYTDSAGIKDTTKRRFYNVLVQMFNDGLLECQIDPNPRS